MLATPPGSTVEETTTTTVAPETTTTTVVLDTTTTTVVPDTTTTTVAVVGDPAANTALHVDAVLDHAGVAFVVGVVVFALFLSIWLRVAGSR